MSGLAEVPVKDLSGGGKTESPSTQESAHPDFMHLLQGRYSEHLIFEFLQRVHATDALFLLAYRRAF